MRSLADEYGQGASNRAIAEGYLSHLRDGRHRAPITVHQYAARLDDHGGVARVDAAQPA